MDASHRGRYSDFDARAGGGGGKSNLTIEPSGSDGHRGFAAESRGSGGSGGKRSLTGSRSIYSLDVDLLCTIFSLLDHFDLVRCSVVCKAWYHVVYTSSLMRDLYEKRNSCIKLTAKSLPLEISTKLYLGELAMEEHKLSFRRASAKVDQWNGHHTRVNICRMKRGVVLSGVGDKVLSSSEEVWLGFGNFLLIFFVLLTVLRLWSAKSCKYMDEYIIPETDKLVDYEFDENKIVGLTNSKLCIWRRHGQRGIFQSHEGVFTRGLCMSIPSVTIASSSPSAFAVPRDKSWMLNFGASAHITSNKSIFSSSFVPSSLFLVRLANDTYSSITGRGIVGPTANITLDIILFAPKFSVYTRRARLEPDSCSSPHIPADPNALRPFDIDLRLFVKVLTVVMHTTNTRCLTSTCNGTCLVPLSSYIDPEAVIGCEDGRVRVFDMYSGKCSRIFRVHSGPVTCLALTDDQLIIGGSTFGNIAVVDLTSGERLAFARSNYCPTGDLPANVKSSQIISIFPPSDAGLKTLSYNMNSHLLFAGSTSGYAHCWDIRTMRSVWETRVSPNVIYTVHHLSIDTSTLAVGGLDGVLRILDQRTGEILSSLVMDDAAISIKSANDNQKVSEKKARSLPQNACLYNVPRSLRPPITCLSVGMKKIVTTHNEKFIRIWRFQDNI
ncbi:hypothetical protein ZIOFF_065044 [Zingiber officinale]|uniref:F-box domain-containing protein n=1 Tax=Zingiber officinale TaxID=94328 RepID=A0A8J5K8Q0_ZINOF|nr:hypothetical protein ZIOFF_065044 [Zingiber officinale]